MAFVIRPRHLGFYEVKGNGTLLSPVRGRLIPLADRGECCGERERVLPEVHHSFRSAGVEPFSSLGHLLFDLIPPVTPVTLMKSSQSSQNSFSIPCPPYIGADLILEKPQEM